jgi:hypothetical protein
VLKRFDKNGDAKLDETELAAMRASFADVSQAPQEPRSPGTGEERRDRRDPSRDRDSRSRDGQ